MCPFDFFSAFEVIRILQRATDDILHFQKNNNLQHPSYDAKQDRFIQGVRQRSRQHLIKVFQYDFPDTADFGGSLLDPNMEVTTVMETYCELVLLLFLPYRELQQLMHNGSFTLKLRKVLEDAIIGKEELQFLQNLQDAKSNSLRDSTVLGDALERTTQPFMAQKQPSAHVDDNDSDDDVSMQAHDFDRIMEMLLLDTTDASSDTDDGTVIPKIFSVMPQRLKGTRECGYKCLPDMNATQLSSEPLIEIEHPWSQPENTALEIVDDGNLSTPFVNREQIVRLLIERTTRRSRTFQQITNSNSPVYVLEANGSVESIIDWATRVNLDRRQRRAFEIIVGTFVLSVMRESDEHECAREHRSPFVTATRKLKKLVER
jgi:hypothetical protein